MIIRSFLAALAALVLTLALPGVANATVSSGNSLGSYTCNAWGTGDKSAGWTCTVRDKACDGRGVYVQVALNNGNIWTGFFRATPNGGGCGSSKTFRDSTTWSSTIREMYFRLCQDVPRAPDKCYDSTERRDS